ncbi:hypothetical protein ACFY2R_07065 [Micromonospora olivasterospora]|uniref:Uncharacterized protein n=1 Tax=Micromonospora olivasterospora TaxID=1880 RepID=A0A562I6R9_MICOL|nr:hypothetical protein [Micromonospora olivasterospora]TWH66405.1 hypothetical protein JD77_01357 [Micromonospora olivasterospora]
MRAARSPLFRPGAALSEEGNPQRTRAADGCCGHCSGRRSP